MSGNQRSTIGGDVGSCGLNSNPGALAASTIVKSTGGNLYGISIHNTKASAQYIQIFDSATLPADAAVPLICYAIGAHGDVIQDWVPPRRFANGIVICNSSTDATKTIGSADCIIDTQYF